MSDIPEIQAIGADFSTVEDNLRKAKAMISLAKDAGESTAEWDARLRELEIKKDKWTRALAARGVDVKPSE